jgi:hypothetical protein
MQYILMTYEAPEDFSARNNETASAYWAGWHSYTEALKSAGVLIGGNPLMDVHTATTLSMRDGKQHVHDGPFADTKEQLGGYFIIETSDLDSALIWASRCPCVARGSIEVRPILKISNADVIGN